MLQRAASNAYSWWWASHIRTKQSKWLDSHLQDMEHRVKCMLLLLGEEADSFSKRAEMYYKRRPEVITQVEEVYRAYRGLADRYDIMSGELHKANHTIATAFPDQVQYAMLEEEDDNIPKAFTPVDQRRIHKSTVDGLMMKKKKKGGGGGEQLPPSGGTAPIDKDNAREEISRLQKEILVMQTEKEFIKSSYETGIAKYWDLEKNINEMQEQVCHFQDKFDESAVIEDDEARALMTATALKSCQDTIVKLQEQRKTSAGQAMGESERVKLLRERVKAIMNGHGRTLPEPGDKNARKSHGLEMEEAQHVRAGEFETQTVLDKIKEHFERDGDISVAEITEQIDELVDKVVDLELMVSSQTSQVDRLCRENSELEDSLRSLEEENASLVSGSDEVNERLKKLEEEMVRVQALESCFHKDESTIRSSFREAISRLSDISEMLQSPAASARTLPDAKAEAEVDPGQKSASAAATQEVDPGEKSAAAAATPAVEERGISRERGSLVRLRHISSDNLGGCDDDDALQAEEGGDEAKKKVAEYKALLEEHKRKLAELERKNQECMQEIKSLRELVSSSEAAAGGGDGSGGRRGHRRTPSYSLGHHRKQSLSSISRMIRMGSTIPEGDESSSSEVEEVKLELPAVATSSSSSPSPLEDKFRKDIDTLLEENLEFWMKFSSSLQRVQEFQRKHDELLLQLQQASNGDKQKQEQQLRALKTELQVWSEQNAMLRGELQCRFASLCDVQEEITAALEGEEGHGFTSYQAAKFQGEVLNMQQENNRVSDELQAGQDHVKGLQAEIEKRLLHGGVALPDADAAAGPPALTRVASKSKVPLQSFLFPAKTKKPSLFARVTPVVLQKQQPDLRFLAKLQPR
ncbi:protein NETWORKED 2D-like isoform X2 [Oryza brachyantha]|uniref:protein NETWORKED 2D-like isoform X2 n=1 Tax=Oryza brachyantha TaxID=4533 RepID=UPI0007761EF5|nr:protein NETWORKED 2D-like isoform X2 [Oryza brachyantha]